MIKKHLIIFAVITVVLSLSGCRKAENSANGDNLKPSEIYSIGL